MHIPHCIGLWAQHDIQADKQEEIPGPAFGWEQQEEGYQGSCQMSDRIIRKTNFTSLIMKFSR